MNPNPGIIAPQNLADTHDCAASADARDECFRLQFMKIQLPPDLGTGGQLMSLDVCLVGKLGWKKDPRLFMCQLLSQTNASDKTALIATYGNNFCAQTSDQGDAFLAHPVGHENHDFMTQRSPNRGKRNSGVAAGGLGNGISRL